MGGDPRPCRVAGEAAARAGAGGDPRSVGSGAGVPDGLPGGVAGGGRGADRGGAADGGGPERDGGEFQRVTEAAAKREGASQAGVWKYAFLGIAGMDGERGRAPGETVVVIRGIDRDQGWIFGRQERAHGRELEQAKRLGLDRDGPTLGL